METRTCQSCKKEFRIESEDVEFYNRIRVPPPTWCPECRMARRFVFRNNRHLFRRKDERIGQGVLSGFPAAAPVKVYNLEFWNSDGWDAMEYGREYDFSYPFFDQIRELLYTAPLPARSVVRFVNSDYCDHAADLRNSYLCFNGSNAENSAYLINFNTIKESMDLYESRANELCYNSLQVDECYRTAYSFDCVSCQEVWFSKDLSGCSYCFGCVNLRNKSYHIFNKPYSKEEYAEKLKELNLGSYGAMREHQQKSHSLWERFPVKYMHGYRNTDGSSGEHIQDTKRVKNSFCIHGAENLRYSQLLDAKVTDAYDYTIWGEDASLMYECLECGEQVYGLKFSWDSWPSSRDLEYCISCRSSSDLFGCVSLKKKQYCIFNKQYSKEDYFVLREKIIKHMNEMPYTDKQGRVYRYGEFFPPELSPFAYNETMAQDFFPLTVEAAAKAGYLWREPEAREYQTTINAADLPDHINDIQDSILQEIIKCASCGKAYRIIPMELDFYRRMTLPLPRLCPNCRFLERFKFVNPPRFWHRKCQCAGSADERGIYKNIASHFHGLQHCPNEFETSYAPERPEIVYCEQCYQSEVA